MTPAPHAAVHLSPTTDLIVHDLGRMAYGPAVEFQRRLVDQVAAAGAAGRPAGPGHLLLVEHDPPVITTGRRACDEQVLASVAELSARGVELHRTARGGLATYHAPGQLVAYPILHLPTVGRGVRQYVRGLEQAVIAALAGFGLRARREEGLTGVWVGTDKIAAIGVAVSRRVTWHGLALNVSTDLGGFDLIVPCGLRGRGVTSMSRALGRGIEVAEVKPRLVACLCAEFGLRAVDDGGASEAAVCRPRE